MDKISVIVPVYNEEEAIPKYYEEFKKFIKTMKTNFELIFVIDGAKDNSYKIIKELSKKDEIVNYILLSKNFGKDAAMYAGLEYATGDYVTIMDVDLQDPLILLKDMYNAVKNEGYDSAAAHRVNRIGEAKIRSFFARLFYKLMRKTTHIDICDGARDYRLMNNQMKESVLELKERERFLKGIYGWVGYNTKWIPYENINRVDGETQWSFWKLFKNYIIGIIGFTSLPLTFATIFGILFILAAIILLITSIFVRMNILTIIVMFFVSGVQLITIGLIGSYLSKIYTEVKQRPIYLIKDKKIKKNIK